MSTDAADPRQVAHILADSAGLRKIAGLLDIASWSLGSETPPARLDSVELHPESLRLVFSAGETLKIRIWASPRGGERPFADNRTLGFRFEDDLDEVTAAIIKVLVKDLDGVSFGMLERIVGAGGIEVLSEITDTQPAPGQTGAESDSEPSIKSWGAPAQWREFCAFGYLEGSDSQSILGEFEIVGDAVSVRHGEMECMDTLRYISPNSVQPSPINLFVQPSAQSDFLSPRQYYLTFIDDRDVVMGTGTRKIDRILDYLADKDWCGLIELKNCCVPMLTGDDVQASIRRYCRKCGKPVFFVDMHTDSRSRLVDFIRGLDSRQDPPRIPGGYNLVGFNPARNRDELTSILAESGARLNFLLLPEFPMDRFADYRKAPVQVLLPNVHYQEIYGALAEMDLVTVSDAAPFGVRGTHEWLKRVAGAIGGEVAEHAPEVWRRRWDAVADEWTKNTLEAGNHRLGLILDEKDIPLLSSPEFTGGAVLPLLLEEMGFRLDIAVFGNEPGQTLAMPFSGLLEHPDRHRVHRFESREELHSLLGGGGISAVYSNFNFDWRLSRNGVGRFSIRDFFFGLDGALKTQNRLLDVCRLPFFSRYGKFLKSKTGSE